MSSRDKFNNVDNASFISFRDRFLSRMFWKKERFSVMATKLYIAIYLLQTEHAV